MSSPSVPDDAQPGEAASSSSGSVPASRSKRARDASGEEKLGAVDDIATTCGIMPRAGDGDLGYWANKFRACCKADGNLLIEEAERCRNEPNYFGKQHCILSCGCLVGPGVEECAHGTLVTWKQCKCDSPHWIPGDWAHCPLTALPIGHGKQCRVFNCLAQRCSNPWNLCWHHQIAIKTFPVVDMAGDMGFDALAPFCYAAPITTYRMPCGGLAQEGQVVCSEGCVHPWRTSYCKREKCKYQALATGNCPLHQMQVDGVPPAALARPKSKFGKLKSKPKDSAPAAAPAPAPVPAPAKEPAPSPAKKLKPLPSANLEIRVPISRSDLKKCLYDENGMVPAAIRPSSHVHLHNLYNQIMSDDGTTFQVVDPQPSIWALDILSRLPVVKLN